MDKSVGVLLTCVGLGSALGLGQKRIKQGEISIENRLNLARRICTGRAGGDVRNSSRWLLALFLYALFLSPALASFPGQSVHQFQLYQGGLDSRQYTDLDALCADAVTSYAQAMGTEVVLQSVADVSCYIQYKTTGVWFTRQIRFEAVSSICPANSYGIISVYQRTTCFCNLGYTESGNACIAPSPKKPIVVGFFNGVWNTEKQAGDGRRALEKLIGPTYKGAELKYENFYNQTGAGNGNSMLQDIAEVFVQRQKELDGVLNNRWEHYWELLAGKHAEGDSLTARLLNGLGNGASALAGLIDSTFNAMLGQILSGYSQMLSSPPTAADMADQLQKLRALADEENSFALIAHSQGNLFVNSAYDGLRSSHPDTSVGVVHLAPASPTLRGEHVLADIDLVINGLRIQGINTVASNNISLPASKSDLSGHTLVGTYLDAARASREKVNSMVQTVLGRL